MLITTNMLNPSDPSELMGRIDYWRGKKKCRMTTVLMLVTIAC